MQETWVPWEDPLEKETATYPSVLARRIPWTVACQAPLSMGFPRQGYWNSLPFPFPGDLARPGIEPTSPVLAGRFFTTEPPGKPTQVKECVN